LIDKLLPILNNNLGNVLTRELAYGILTALQESQRDEAINIQDIPAVEYADNLLQVERIEDVLEELKPVHAAHWQETERYRHGIALNPDYNYMINAERTGRFMLFTVRNDDGLVGNCMMYLSRSTHTQRWVAEEDTIFILPEYRKGRLGVRLIRYVEDVLRNMGVTEIRVTVKTVNDVGRLLTHLGYNHTGNQLTKTLE
jgi:GNAT superfamily N-acetyltransferase